MGKNKRFVYADTISNGVYGFDGRKSILPTSPNEVKKGKIGSFDVTIRRHEYLNNFGNPLYDVYVFDGKTGKNGSSKGSDCAIAVGEAINKAGCKVRR